MATMLEERLDALVHEIRDIKRDLLMDKIKRLAITKSRMTKWKTLSKKVTARWDHVSAFDEIRQQREKSW